MFSVHNQPGKRVACVDVRIYVMERGWATTFLEQDGLDCTVLLYEVSQQKVDQASWAGRGCEFRQLVC